MVTWTITAMFVQKQEGTLQDVVYLIDWVASDTDGVNTARIGGSTELAPPQPGSFIAYADITQQQAIDWVKNTMGVDRVYAIENELNLQIVYMQSPPVETPPLPWEV